MNRPVTMLYLRDYYNEWQSANHFTVLTQNSPQGCLGLLCRDRAGVV